METVVRNKLVLVTGIGTRDMHSLAKVLGHLVLRPEQWRPLRMSKYAKGTPRVTTRLHSSVAFESSSSTYSVSRLSEILTFEMSPRADKAMHIIPMGHVHAPLVQQERTKKTGGEKENFILAKILVK